MKYIGCRQMKANKEPLGLHVPWFFFWYHSLLGWHEHHSRRKCKKEKFKCNEQLNFAYSDETAPLLASLLGHGLGVQSDFQLLCGSMFSCLSGKLVCCQSLASRHFVSDYNSEGATSSRFKLDRSDHVKQSWRHGAHGPRHWAATAKCHLLWARQI